jgi:hypothetical protein
MVDNHGALERVRARPPSRRAGGGTLAGLVRPAGTLAGMVLLRVLEDPRARQSIARAARAMAGRLADRRPADRRPAERTPATQASGVVVLVRRVETTQLVIYRGSEDR